MHLFGPELQRVAKDGNTSWAGQILKGQRFTADWLFSAWVGDHPWLSSGMRKSTAIDQEYL
jgi:hypothetical protein